MISATRCLELKFVLLVLTFALMEARHIKQTSSFDVNSRLRSLVTADQKLIFKSDTDGNPSSSSMDGADEMLRLKPVASLALLLLTGNPEVAFKLQTTASGRASGGAKMAAQLKASRCMIHHVTAAENGAADGDGDKSELDSLGAAEWQRMKKLQESIERLPDDALPRDRLLLEDQLAVFTKTRLPLDATTEEVLAALQEQVNGTLVLSGAALEALEAQMSKLYIDRYYKIAEAALKKIDIGKVYLEEAQKMFDAAQQDLESSSRNPLESGGAPDPRDALVRSLLAEKALKDALFSDEPPEEE